MIKIENIEVIGWEHSIRGMRNPMNSWDESDSGIVFEDGEYEGINYHNAYYEIGTNDLDLMTKLSKAGADHRKYMRMIVVYADITAPLYWWKEYDTYKVGTVANSTSTMHKIHEKKFVLDDFSHDRMTELGINHLCDTIEVLNTMRSSYLDSKDKAYWYDMIQTLPTSYNQKRTVMLNYEVLANMYHSRKNHKLDEWQGFCEWIESLEYSEIITGGQNED